jgi:hypothetical protein
MPISEVKYPDLERIMNLKPNPHILLGKEITWTEKRDGSNLGIYLDNGVWHVRSRNMDIASEQFHAYFKSTPEFENVLDLLQDAANWGDEYMLFGELLIKGKSPTKLEFHEETRFVAFDLWSVKAQGFVNYTKLYQECYHHHIPLVELWGTCRAKSLETLLTFRDAMLEKSLDMHREGSVGKYVNGIEYIYFKEKNDVPKYEKIPRVEDPDNMKIILPPLPESELTGAIEKAYADLGDAFFDIRTAMPKIAEYVAIEQHKHNCFSPDKKLFAAYKSRLEELQK